MASLTSRRRLGPVAAIVAALVLMPVAAWAARSLPNAEGPPQVVTGGDHANGTSDELSGTINPHKVETTYWFEYGPTNSYGSKTSTGTLKAEPAEPISVSETATGMQPGWRYRLAARNAKGEEAFGHEHTFAVKTSKKTTGKTGLLLTQPEPVLIGETLELSGTLNGVGNAGREVVLQASPYPYRSAFADVGAPTLTDSAGHFAFSVAHLSINTHFRVSTVDAPILTSKVVNGMAAVRVVLKVRTSKAKRGLVRLYGTVTPAEVGAHIYFQLEKQAKPNAKLPGEKPEKSRKSEGASGKSESASEKEKPPAYTTKFSSFVKRGTKSLSRFSIVVTIQTTGLYRALVVVPPGPLTSGYSGTIVLRSATAKHKTKKQ